MDEAAQEGSGKPVDDRPLPLDEDEGPFVLVTGTVLGKKARPMLGIRVDVGATGSKRPPDPVGKDLRHGQRQSDMSPG